jgi:hypothetical protein
MDMLLRYNSGVFNFPCVNAAIELDTEQKTIIKSRALSMLGDLDNEFCEVQSAKPSDRQFVKLLAHWRKRMDVLRGFLEKW